MGGSHLDPFGWLRSGSTCIDPSCSTIGLELKASNPYCRSTRCRSIRIVLTITVAEVVDDGRLRLTFDDGSERTVDLAGTMRGTMGEPLRDPAFFRQVRVDPELGTVVWPNGLDLDPDVLHGDFEPAGEIDIRLIDKSSASPS